MNVKDLANEQHNKNGVLEANRGTIYDQTGKVLVQDSTTYRVVVNLKGNDKVKNKDETAEQLATALEIDKEDVLKISMRGVRKLKSEKLAGICLGKRKNKLKIENPRCFFYA